MTEWEVMRSKGRCYANRMTAQISLQCFQGRVALYISKALRDRLRIGRDAYCRMYADKETHSKLMLQFSKEEIEDSRQLLAGRIAITSGEVIDNIRQYFGGDGTKRLTPLLDDGAVRLDLTTLQRAEKVQR